MNIIRARGPQDTVASLDDILDFIIIEYSGQTLPSGEVQLSGYATDRAIAEIQSRGATVEVLIDNEELEATEADLFARIAAQEPVA